MTIVRSFFLMLLLGSIATSMSIAQIRVIGPEYPVTKSTMSGNHLQPGEKVCQYFFSTTILGADQPRVSFSYIQNGKTESEMPRVEDLTVVIDESKSSPTIQETGKNDNGKQQYTLRLSSATAESEAPCLAGVARKR